jgi:dUTP pyrophosphatase
MQISIKKLRESAIVPTRAHSDDAGIDLFTDREYILAPRTLVVIPLGVAFEMPLGYVGLIWDKSSIGSKNIKTLGGVVDAGYRGEVSVVLNNLGDGDYIFKVGDKVAQMLIQKIELCELVQVGELSDSSRGKGGFGSTGR